MNYVDQSAVRTFSLNIFDGAANVGSTSFVTASINRAVEGILTTYVPG